MESDPASNRAVDIGRKCDAVRAAPTYANGASHGANPFITDGHDGKHKTGRCWIGVARESDSRMNVGPTKGESKWKESRACDFAIGSRVVRDVSIDRDGQHDGFRDGAIELDGDES